MNIDNRYHLLPEFQTLAVGNSLDKTGQMCVLMVEPDRAPMLRQSPVYTWPFWLLMEPGAFLMQRKMLMEIKHRCETTGNGGRDAPSATVGALTKSIQSDATEWLLAGAISSAGPCQSAFV